MSPATRAGVPYIPSPAVIVEDDSRRFRLGLHDEDSLPRAPVIDLGKARPISEPIQVAVDADPLAIPHFLRRQVPAKSQESWK